jgi:hypothetical protein
MDRGGGKFYGAMLSDVWDTVHSTCQTWERLDFVCDAKEAKDNSPDVGHPSSVVDGNTMEYEVTCSLKLPLRSHRVASPHRNISWAIIGGSRHE